MSVYSVVIFLTTECAEKSDVLSHFLSVLSVYSVVNFLTTECAENADVLSHFLSVLSVYSVVNFLTTKCAEKSDVYYCAHSCGYFFFHFFSMPLWPFSRALAFHVLFSQAKSSLP